MQYTALALKYRPKDFSQVVGQAQAVAALKGAIVTGRIHHAYLFSGPRGVGKTSMARILAKSLNCENGPTVSPCGKCLSCSEIAKGTSLDIIEIDGASNRGIDDIRSLRENVKLTSAGSRFKVYIIDEVHQITADGFNALLKTLEEPPPHVKFIFATTHPQKVPPTILSRCQKFQFSLLEVEQIALKLKKEALAEKLKIEDSLIYTVARAATGSIRDAESLLDQIIPVLSQGAMVDDVLSFLGVINEQTLNQTVQFLASKDLSGTLNLIDKVSSDGKDLSVFLNAFLEHLRIILLAKVSPKNFASLTEVSPDTKTFITKLTTGFSAREALRMIELLIQAKEYAFKLNSIRIPLELAIIKFCDPQITRVEPQEPKPAVVSTPEVKCKPVKSNHLGGGNSSQSQEASSDKDFEHQINELDMGEPDQIVIKKEDNSPEGEDDDILINEVKTKWSAIVSGMQKIRAAIASHLSYAAPISSRGKMVTIGFASRDYFHKEVVETAKNIKFIEGVISQELARPAGVKFVLVDQGESFAKPQQDQSQVLGSENIPSGNTAKEEDSGFINDLLDTFSGSISNDD